MPFSAAPGDFKGDTKDRIMHARLAMGSAVLMASDTMPEMPFTQGNNFSVSIQCDDAGQIDRIFTALSAGGTVTMPLQKTFWAPRFGMLKDKFGIGWMLNLEAPKQ
jgi:PhnB protein